MFLPVRNLLTNLTSYLYSIKTLKYLSMIRRCTSNFQLGAVAGI